MNAKQIQEITQIWRLEKQKASEKKSTEPQSLMGKCQKVYIFNLS